MTEIRDIHRLMEPLRRLLYVNDADYEFEAHLDRLIVRGDGAISARPARFGQMLETRGILVVGEPGCCKTTLVARGLEKHTLLPPGPDGLRPYLASEVPSPASLKALLKALLRKSGYPIDDRSRRTADDLTVLLRNRMAANGQFIIWIDEGHDLFCNDAPLILRSIKSLMQGADSLVVVMSGTEDLHSVICSDRQVRRRFTVVRPPDLVESVDGERLTKIVVDYCKRVCLAPPKTGDLAGRLIHAARGQFGNAVEMAQDACEQALIAGDEALTHYHFAQMWGMREGPDPTTNPFLVADWRTLDLDLPVPGMRARRGQWGGRR